MKRTHSRFALFALSVLCLFALCSCNYSGNDSNVSGSASADSSKDNDDKKRSDAIKDSATAMGSDLDDVGNAIKNFVEGTIVDITSVPSIVKAVTDKYDRVTVTGISHATHLNKQMYEVTYTDTNGDTHTVYVSPNGDTVIEATEPGGSESPMPSATASEEG